jgi:hypothetical protein
MQGETIRDGRELLGYSASGYGYWRDNRDRYIYQTTPDGRWNGWYSSLEAWERTMHRILDLCCAHCGITRYAIDHGARVHHSGTPGHHGYREAGVCCIAEAN